MPVNHTYKAPPTRLECALKCKSLSSQYNNIECLCVPICMPPHMSIMQVYTKLNVWFRLYRMLRENNQLRSSLLHFNSQNTWNLSVYNKRKPLHMFYTYDIIYLNDCHIYIYMLQLLYFLYLYQIIQTTHLEGKGDFLMSTKYVSVTR